MLVVVSGLPGVGKSTLADAVARRLGAAVLSVDPIEAAMLRCGIQRSFETGVAAYEVAAVMAEHQLRLGLVAIADAVSSLEVAREVWRQAAHRAGTPLRTIQVVCSDPDVHRARLAGRTRGIEGFPEPTWEEVVARAEEWEAPTDDPLVLDSVHPLVENVERAVGFLSS